jgi:hypothetical protein
MFAHGVGVLSWGHGRTVGFVDPSPARLVPECSGSERS